MTDYTDMNTLKNLEKCMLNKSGNLLLYYCVSARKAMCTFESIIFRNCVYTEKRCKDLGINIWRNHIRTNLLILIRSNWGFPDQVFRCHTALPEKSWIARYVNLKSGITLQKLLQFLYSLWRNHSGISCVEPNICKSTLHTNF